MKSQSILILAIASNFPYFATAHPHSIPAFENPKVLVSRKFDKRDLYANWPSYDELPLDPSYPTKAAWGVWGADDVQGALNHITNETILAAASEIKLGWAFNLNLDLNEFITPINTARKPLNHLFQPGDSYTDDVVVLNTQVSTQYDGLRHFPYSTNGNTTTYQWYNDLIENYEEVIGPSPTSVLGIQQAAQKGIAGRGVLLDWAGWAETQNISYSAFAVSLQSPYLYSSTDENSGARNHNRRTRRCGRLARAEHQLVSARRYAHHSHRLDERIPSTDRFRTRDYTVAAESRIHWHARER